jgi:hypothetical protein
MSHLVGFCNGVLPQAVSSASSSNIGSEALSNLMEEDRIMSSEIEEANSRYNKLSNDTNKIQSDFDVGLQPLASSAVEGMNILGRSIVDLYKFPDQSKTLDPGLIAKCKDQGLVVAHRFNERHKDVQDILRRAGDVSNYAPVGCLILLI